MKKSMLLLVMLAATQQAHALSESAADAPGWKQFGNAATGYSYGVYNRADSFTIRCHPNKPATINVDIMSVGKYGSQDYQSDFVFEVDGYRVTPQPRQAPPRPTENPFRANQQPIYL